MYCTYIIIIAQYYSFSYLIFIFYFHNDPISMKGSKTIKERLKILNSVLEKHTLKNCPACD